MIRELRNAVIAIMLVSFGLWALVEYPDAVFFTAVLLFAVVATS